jgi:hypothetical protein
LPGSLAGVTTRNDDNGDVDTIDAEISSTIDRVIRARSEIDRLRGEVEADYERLDELQERWAAAKVRSRLVLA